jgi:hypothetical protein
MNVSLFLSDLNQSLGAGVSMPGFSGVISPGSFQYSPGLQQMAMCLAVRGYSRWRRPLRPYGSGVLYSQANAGTNVLQVIGGPWTTGSTILVDFGTVQETFTILGIGPGSQLPNWMGTPTALTLSGNLSYTHAAGVFVGLNPPGLAVIPAVQYYALPSDFAEMDSKTFNYANGSQGAMVHQQAFYDAATFYSQMLSGVGYAQSQTFMASGGVGIYAFYGIPDGPSTFNPPANGGCETLWQVMEGNPPILAATPVPNFTGQWVFNYYGTHQPETVPDSDFDALMELARAIATESATQLLAGRLSFKEDDVSESPHLNAAALLDVSKMAREIFDIKIRKRPYCITG